MVQVLQPTLLNHRGGNKETPSRNSIHSSHCIQEGKEGPDTFSDTEIVSPHCWQQEPCWEDRSHRAESFLEDISSGQMLPGQQKAKLLEPFTFQALASKQEVNSNSHWHGNKEFSNSFHVGKVIYFHLISCLGMVSFS